MNAHPATLAKLTRPHLTGILSRERLFGYLDQGREKSVIWVSGPPGTGKTTLVADYLDTWAPECIWYQADEGDADVATFFHYMAQALPPTDKGERPALPRFTPEYQNNLSAFTRRYFRELFAHLTSPFALVLDNYQEVPTQSRLHEVMRDGLQEIPTGSCVIFISRREPPTSMARLRANQMMEVLDPDDLKLNRAECDALVKVRGHELGDEDLQQLFEKTQGWAAGVVLLLGRTDNQAPPAEMHADMTPQVVFDYLAGEIFEDVSQDTRDLLTKTAWLRQFTAEMADALSGHDDSERILERMTREDYFVTARHGGNATVYQYHPLLREFLLKRVDEQMSSTERTTLQSRAAELLEESGQIEDTVALRVAARDWQELARLIQEHATDMLRQGRGETLEQWLQELPPTQLEKDPWLLHWLAACRLPFAPRESRRLYEQAFDLFGAGENPDHGGMFSALAGVMFAVINDLDDLTVLDRWIEESLKLNAVSQDFPSPEVEAQVISYTFMSMVFRQPFHPDIEAWGERTAALLETTRNQDQLAAVSVILAAALTWTGGFSRTESALRALGGLASDPKFSMVSRAMRHNVESMYFMMIGDYDACIDAVNAGVELADTTGISHWRNRTLISGIGGALGVGNLEMADELAEQLDQRALAHRRFDSCLFHYFRGWKMVLENDVLSAYRELRNALRNATEIGLPYFEVLCGLALAQVLFACGDHQKGRRYLRDVRKVAVTIQSPLMEYSSLLTFAQIALDHGRPRSGINSLRYALRLGRERGYTHTLWWQPAAMARLCVFALEEGVETDYVRSLIEKRGLVPDRPPLNVDAWPWQFRVRTLGQFELLRDGKTSLLKGRGQGRPIEVLKMAIAMGGTNVSVDRITDALWPNIDRDYAHRSFNTTLHRLRKLLGEDTSVTLTNNQLTLNDQFFWLDTWAFEQSLDQLRKALNRNLETEDIQAIVDRVLELYQGGFLPGDEDSAWVVSPREQLRNKFSRFINDVGHWLEQQQRFDDAVEFYFRGLEVDELAESTYRRLMLCFQGLGRRAEAIDVYNRCCKTLESGLGVSPSRETTDLYDTMVSAA